MYCIYPPFILLSSYGFERIFKIRRIQYKYFILVFAVTFMGLCIFSNIKLILESPHNYFFSSPLTQESFKLLHRDAQYNNQRVYIYLQEAKDEKVSQDILLALELSGNLRPEDGGLKVWEKDKNLYLIIQKKFE